MLLSARPCHAQDIEPRRWSHLPLDTNFLGVAYAYSSGDITLDPVLGIQDGQFDLQTIGVKYIRSFELLGKSARFDIMQSYQSGSWNGLVNGVPTEVTRNGLADTSMRLAVNLYGAPPLAGKEFADYRARTDCETIVGMGLVVQLPTGQYYDDKLINLGSNRFAFRPQLGVVHNRGKWSGELTTAATFFTANEDFFNGRRLQQDPVLSADANLIYTFSPGLWLAASLGYGDGGITVVNGVANNDRQNNLGFGLSLGIPITRALGVKFGYTGTRTHARTGSDVNTFACAISVMW